MEFQVTLKHDHRSDRAFGEHEEHSETSALVNGIMGLVVYEHEERENSAGKMLVREDYECSCAFYACDKSVLCLALKPKFDGPEHRFSILDFSHAERPERVACSGSSSISFAEEGITIQGWITRGFKIARIQQEHMAGKDFAPQELLGIGDSDKLQLIWTQHAPDDLPKAIDVGDIASIFQRLSETLPDDTR